MHTPVTALLPTRRETGRLSEQATGVAAQETAWFGPHCIVQNAVDTLNETISVHYYNTVQSIYEERSSLLPCAFAFDDDDEFEESLKKGWFRASKGFILAAGLLGRIPCVCSRTCGDEEPGIAVIKYC